MVENIRKYGNVLAILLLIYWSICIVNSAYKYGSDVLDGLDMVYKQFIGIVCSIFIRIINIVIGILIYIINHVINIMRIFNFTFDAIINYMGITQFANEFIGIEIDFFDFNHVFVDIIEGDICNQMKHRNIHNNYIRNHQCHQKYIINTKYVFRNGFQFAYYVIMFSSWSLLHFHQFKFISIYNLKLANLGS